MMGSEGGRDTGPSRRSWPRCIHLTGVDGAGKTTQARAILSLLRGQDIPARHVWLRFPRLTCAPFLAYARLRGYSRQEAVDGHRHGYWDFTTSWLMSKVFPWALWLDTFLMALVKIYVPLGLGHTLVCDRFVGDVLVDLAVGLDDARFAERVPGRLFLALLPRDTQVVVLDLDTNVARRRRRALKGDRSHSQRRAAYLDLARLHHLPVVSADAPIETVMARLVDVITGTGVPGRSAAMGPAGAPPSPHRLAAELRPNDRGVRE